MKFTPAVSGAYTVYTDDDQTNVCVDYWDSGADRICMGVVGRFRNGGSDLRNITMLSGVTYLLHPSLSEGESAGLRIVSYADELKEAKARSLPALTGREEQNTRIAYTGAQDCVAARIVPAATGEYRVSLSGNLYKAVCGEHGVYGSENGNYSIDASLIAGEEYLLYVRSGSGEPAEGEVRVTLKARNTQNDYPLERTQQQIAAELAQGPVRYTVLIFDDDGELGTNGNTAVIEDQKQTARELCEALAAASGTSYVALVGMGTYQRAMGTTPTQVCTDPCFTADLNALRSAIDDWFWGGSRAGCDIMGALREADRLLYPVQTVYGTAAEVNVVLISDGGNKSSGPDKGPYMVYDHNLTESWVNPRWCNSCHSAARYYKSLYPLYVVNINSYKSLGNSYDTWPVSGETYVFLARFLRDLSSGDGYYREMYDMTGGADTLPLTGAGGQTAEAILGRCGTPRENALLSVRLSGTQLQYQISPDAPIGAKLVAAAYNGSGRLVGCRIREAVGSGLLTVPGAESYRVFLVSRDLVPLAGALTGLR